MADQEKSLRNFLKTYAKDPDFVNAIINRPDVQRFVNDESFEIHVYDAKDSTIHEVGGYMVAKQMGERFRVQFRTRDITPSGIGLVLIEAIGQLSKTLN